MDACNLQPWRLSPHHDALSVKIPQSMAPVLQFPDLTTAITPSPTVSPRFHVDAVRMDSYSCDAVAFAWLILHGRVGLGIRQLSYRCNNLTFVSRDTVPLCKRKATAFANVMGL